MPSSLCLPQLFFAKVLRTASEEEVVALFSRYGQVAEVNLFRAFQGAPTSKGCGLVTYSAPSEAAAAIAGLDATYTWPGADGPMVVKWMDTALQRKRRDEHLAAMRQGLVPSMSMSEWGGCWRRAGGEGGLGHCSRWPSHYDDALGKIEPAHYAVRACF